MHDDRVACARFENELADGFEERKPLDVASGAAYFRDDDIRSGVRAHLANAGFDFIGDVRDDLNGLAEVVATAFLGEDGLVDLAAGEVIGASEDAICEALVVSEVEVGLRTVGQNIDLTMLERIHRAGIDIEVGVEFLENDFETPQFQQRAE